MAVGCPAFVFGRPSVPPLRNSRRASGFVVGADDLGGPRAHCVRPYREKKRRAVNVLWEGESPRRFAPPFDKGGLCGRTFLRPKRCRSRAHPHPPRCARHLPPRRGKAGGCKSRPYGRNWTVSEERREGRAPPLRGLRIPLVVWVGETLGPPVVNGPCTVGPAKAGAVVEPRLPQFFTNPGPSGPAGI